MRRRTRGVAHLVAGPARPNLGVRFPVMPGSLRFRLPALFLLGIVTVWGVGYKVADDASAVS